MNKQCYIIDTGVLSSILTMKVDVLNQLDKLGLKRDDFSITLVVKSEILIWLNELRGHHDSNVKIDRSSYMKLFNLIESIPVVEMSEFIGNYIAYYFDKNYKYGFSDLMNACIAIDGNCTFITKNKKHYSNYNDIDESLSLKTIFLK